MKRFLTMAVFAVIFLVPIFAEGQSATATKDPQAVQIVTQALVTAGGTSTIDLISDYKATGNVMYHLAEDAQGKVTIRGKGLDELRIDADLPTGVRSEAISRGMMTMKLEDGTVNSRQMHAPLVPTRFLLPYLLLSPALGSPGYNIWYKGTVALAGRSLYDIQVQRILSLAPTPTTQLLEYFTIDFFIDPSTFQVVMVQDAIPRHITRQIRYSNYKMVDGISVPFSIVESGAELPCEINLDQITFNSGLQDSDFQL